MRTGYARVSTADQTVAMQLDVLSAAGYCVFPALAEFERKLISERTKEGLQAARRRGTERGGKPVLAPTAVVQVRSMMADRSIPAAVAERFKISKSPLYKLVRSEDLKQFDPAKHGSEVIADRRVGPEVL